MNILLTGGRAPATLELARAFHKAGHTVFMAESLRGHLSQPSKAVKANFFVPAPRQEKDAFLSAMKNVIAENKIDWLIPTCEEIFHISMGREQFSCSTFVEPIKKLDNVHNKWAFVINAIQQDLSVPETMLVNNVDDMFYAFAHWKEIVFKPIYSRFATQTLIKPTVKQALDTLGMNYNPPWIAQGYINGREICTYSVAHNGHITAHTAYPAIFTAGRGATIAFRHIDHSAIFEWVKIFVEQNKFTGQIAFDFIETADGQIFPLECNPRATSGVHLLASHPRFVEAFLNPQMDCITPNDGHSYMLASAMLIYGLPSAFKKNQFSNWLKTFFTSSDVILDFSDLLPFLLQYRSILSYLKIANEMKISPLEASTFDIEWNGDMGN
jgi:predicted ATP-grasp superfamily ATP-dependent carboligase